MNEFDNDIDEVLNSVEAEDIESASTMARPQRIIGPRSFEGAVKSKVAFNNPGSGAQVVTTSIIDDADISMRAHPMNGGGMAEYDDEYGNTHSGPKFVPGEKRRRKKMGLSGRPPKALKLKPDECVLIRANSEAREAKVNIFVVHAFCGYAFRVVNGPLNNEVLYVLDAELWDQYAADGIAHTLGMALDPDGEGNGWALGGEKVPLSFLEQFVNSILKRVARGQLT